jgi:Fic family protein
MKPVKGRTLAEFVFESDLIESVRNKSKDLWRAVEERTQTGHVGALFLLMRYVEQRRMLDHQTLCSVQKLIMDGQRQVIGGKRMRGIGRYRTKNVAIVRKTILPFEVRGKDRIMIIRTRVRKVPLASDVPVLMEKWFVRMLAWQATATEQSPEENVERIADFHFDFEETHPFKDGNGRTGRAVVFYQLLWAGIEPFAFTEFDKGSTYYPALKDRLAMREYFRVRVFERESILGRIETVSAEDVFSFSDD